MKKIFTIAAAILASVSMTWAVDYYTPADDEVIILKDAYDNTASEAGYSKHAALVFYSNSCNTNSKKAGDPNNDGASTSSNVTCYSPKNNGDSKRIDLNIKDVDSIIIYRQVDNLDCWIDLLVTPDGEAQTKIIGSKCASPFFAHGFSLDPSKSYSIRFQGTKTGSDQQDVWMYAIKIFKGTVTPVVDPVTAVTIEGPEAIYVGKEATYTASTNVKANAYKWFVNDVEQEGAEAKTFAYTPAAAGTYNIVCKAKNDNNADFVVSNTIALVASVRPSISELVVVDNSIVWDFKNAAPENIAAENQNDTVILYNAGDWAEEFASDKLAGRGQYYYYGDNQCFQGHVLKFVTSVPGSIIVEFSNTGKPERPYRHLYVNGTDTEYKSNSTAKVTTEAINVPAGEVILSGMMENGEEEALTLNMLRIYKVSFTKSAGTGIENTDAAVKAVKVVRDGQMMILKNGVLYNMQGAIVK